MAHHQQCALGCKSGHTLLGAASIRCVDGDWELEGSTPTCEPSNCTGIPRIVYGTAPQSCAGMPHSSICNAQCKQGYTLQGYAAHSNLQITCRYGSWQLPGGCVPELVSQAMVSGNSLLTRQGQGASDVFEIHLVPANSSNSRRARLLHDTSDQAFGLGWALLNQAILRQTLAEVLHVDVTALQMQASQLDEQANLSQISGQGFQLAFSFMLPTFAENSSVMEAAGSTRRRLLWSESLITDHLVQAQQRLLFTLEQTLVTAGQTVPSSLDIAEVTFRPGLLTLIDKMVILLPQWIIEKWEPCNCADQIQIRRVECSVDHVESCYVSGAEPPAKQSCKRSKPTPWLGLEDDVKMIIGAGFGALCLCCCACCIVEVRRYFRYTRSGTCRLRDSKDQCVSFNIQKEDGKVHIIWDIDESHCQKFRRTSDEPDENPNLEDNVDDTTAEGGSVGLVIWPTSAVPNPISENARSRDLHPVYAHGASVQYFSVTHKCWLNAWIHLNLHSDKLRINHISYNIQVARQLTMRRDVPLDMLRLPLTVGENV